MNWRTSIHSFVTSRRTIAIFKPWSSSFVTIPKRGMVPTNFSWWLNTMQSFLTRNLTSRCVVHVVEIDPVTSAWVDDQLSRHAEFFDNTEAIGLLSACVISRANSILFEGISFSPAIPTELRLVFPWLFKSSVDGSLSAMCCAVLGIFNALVLYVVSVFRATVLPNPAEAIHFITMMKSERLSKFYCYCSLE